MERGEGISRSHPVGHGGGQDRTAAAGADLDRVAVDDLERGGVGRVDFDERSGIEFVEFGDFPGLGEGVPLMLHATGIEHEGVVVVRQFRGR